MTLLQRVTAVYQNSKRGWVTTLMHWGYTISISCFNHIFITLHIPHRIVFESTIRVGPCCWQKPEDLASFYQLDQPAPADLVLTVVCGCSNKFLRWNCQWHGSRNELVRERSEMQAGKVECWRRLALLCTDNQSNGNILEMEQTDLIIKCSIYGPQIAYSADRFSEASLLDYIFWGWGVLVSKGQITMKPACNNNNMPWSRTA